MRHRPRPSIRPAQLRRTREARRLAAFLHRDRAALRRQNRELTDALAACRGRLHLYADKSATIAECERLTAVLAVMERLLQQERAAHADTAHTLDAAIAVLQEMGAWVRASTSDDDLLIMFYRAWGVSRPPPPRPEWPE